MGSSRLSSSALRLFQSISKWRALGAVKRHELSAEEGQLLAHHRSGGAPHRGPLTEAWQTKFAQVEFFAF